jgi:acyl carrier protein
LPPTDTRAAREVAVTGSPDLLGEITAMLVDITGEDEQWAAAVTADTRLEGDLRLESIEVLALAERLRARFGDRVDLGALYADLDIDGLIALTVGQVVEHVARTAGP